MGQSAVGQWRGDARLGGVSELAPELGVEGVAKGKKYFRARALRFFISVCAVWWTNLVSAFRFSRRGREGNHAQVGDPFTGFSTYAVARVVSCTIILGMFASLSTSDL